MVNCKYFTTFAAVIQIRIFMKKIYSFVMALCVVLCANATPLQGLKKGYQLLPSVAELATGMKKAPAATQGLQYDATGGELTRYYN